MTEQKRCITALAACCLCLLAAFVPAAFAADRKTIVRQARQSYYGLKHEGVLELRCTVKPDFDSIFAAVKADAVGRDQVLPILRRVHFQVVIGPEGASSVSHQSDLAPPNEQVAGRVRKAIEGMEQTVTGFLQTWSMFMVAPPLPDIDSEYQLEDFGERYRLSYKEESATVVTSMNHEFTIDNIKVKTGEFEGSVNPHFERSHKGLILIGYESISKTTSSDEPQQLSVTIGNQEAEGFTLPSTVKAIVPVNGASVVTLLTFADYKIKKR